MPKKVKPVEPRDPPSNAVLRKMIISGKSIPSKAVHK
jgi:hypothetical protein